MAKHKFSLKERIYSFKYAFDGLKILLIEGHNARIHLVAMIVVVTLGIVTQISTTEWISITLCIGFVFAMETMNSSIESLADYIEPEKRPLIKKVKDLAAGAVLISAITAGIIGMIIFIPKLISYV